MPPLPGLEVKPPPLQHTQHPQLAQYRDNHQRTMEDIHLTDGNHHLPRFLGGIGGTGLSWPRWLEG